MRGVFIGVCYKVEVVGVWGCVGCLVGLCMCVSFGLCCFVGVLFWGCVCCLVFDLKF